MRWLNMGPVRIGFYNGPANQVQEALRQQQDGTIGTTAPRLPSRERSTQSQIRALELRLLEQANNLAVEHAQLATLRSMEAEMARLRAQISNTTGGQPNPQVQGSRLFPFTQGFQPPMPQPPQAFQPAHGQQPLGPGHADLPEGMVLPEGWSLLPLQRAGGQMPANNAMPPMLPFGGTGFPPHMMPNLPLNPQAMGLTATFPPPGAQDTNSAQQGQAGQQQNDAPQQSLSEQQSMIPDQQAQPAQPTANPDAVQTNDTSAPWASVASPQESTHPESHHEPATATSQPDQAHSAVDEPSQPQAPWANGGWNFNSPPTEAQTAEEVSNIEASSAAQRTTTEEIKANGHPHTSSVNESQGQSEAEATASYGHKGKGKAVEVEDVPDSES